MTILSREALNRGKDTRGHTGRPFVAYLAHCITRFFLVYAIREMRYAEMNFFSNNNANEKIDVILSFPLTDFFLSLRVTTL